MTREPGVSSSPRPFHPHFPVPRIDPVIFRFVSRPGEAEFRYSPQFRHLGDMIGPNDGYLDEVYANGGEQYLEVSYDAGYSWHSVGRITDPRQA